MGGNFSEQMEERSLGSAFPLPRCAIIGLLQLPGARFNTHPVACKWPYIALLSPLQNGSLRKLGRAENLTRSIIPRVSSVQLQSFLDLQPGARER